MILSEVLFVSRGTSGSAAQKRFYEKAEGYMHCAYRIFSFSFPLIPLYLFSIRMGVKTQCLLILELTHLPLPLVAPQTFGYLLFMPNESIPYWAKYKHRTYVAKQDCQTHHSRMRIRLVKKRIEQDKRDIFFENILIFMGIQVCYSSALIR